MPPTLRTLLARLIDYAGLFPPAGLEMAAAVRNYADYRAGPDAWALGRLIVPAARLDEFEGAAAGLLPREQGADPWPLSVLGSGDAVHDAEAIFNFNERHAHATVGRAVIDTLEVRAADIPTLERLVRSAPAGVTTYVEVPAEDPADLVAALAGVDGRAKIRTGGVTHDAFPASRDVARFIRACAEQAVPFKATAGLHHPVRGEYPLTYDASAERGTMFGYLNIILGGAFAETGLALDDLEALLEERDVRAFTFGDTGVQWRTHVVDAAALERVRTRVAIAVGSCSFTEPLDDLRAAGVLPPAAS